MRYIPGLAQVSRQGQINNVVAKKAYALPNYTDKKALEFAIQSASNTYTNYSSILIA